MKKLILFIFLTTQIVVGFSQTPIEGMINSNTTLTKAKSPYLVTGDLVVFPNCKLTIEPGVKLRFANDVLLQIRGTLEAIGTEDNPILFISNTGNTMGLWKGIEILDHIGGSASFNYCNFSHAQFVIAGFFVVKNSNFTFNEWALSGYNSTVDSCYFANNDICVGSVGIINNCVFENNSYGTYYTSDTHISNSIFINHSHIALLGRGTLSNCVISDNNIGVFMSPGGFSIKNCDISNNQIGVDLLNDYYGVPLNMDLITNSKICNNKIYNVKYHSMSNVDLYTVCWCSSDSATVENLIYDAYDDIWLGFVNYTLFSEDCTEAIFKTHKAEGYTEYLGVNDFSKEEIIIYPNPASSTIFISNAEKINSISIYDYTGKLLMNKSGFHNDLIELNVSEFPLGLYIVRLENQNNTIDFKKVIIAR